jgi:predicted  nucleic acid-binding Zn-ribbon protein
MSAYAWWCERHRQIFDNYMSRGCPDCEDERIARRVIEMMRHDAVTEEDRTATEPDTTPVTLRFARKRGDTYIAVADAVATLRAVIPLSKSNAELIESIELEWRRAADRAFSR